MWGQDYWDCVLFNTSNIITNITQHLFYNYLLHETYCFCVVLNGRWADWIFIKIHSLLVFLLFVVICWHEQKSNHTSVHTVCLLSVSAGTSSFCLMFFICSCRFYMTLMCPWRHTVDLRVMGAASPTSPRASGAVELSTETHNSKVPTSIHQYTDWSLQIKPQTCLDLSSSSSRSAVIQLMAAARAKRGMAFFTFGDDLLKRDLERIHHLLLKEATTVGECSGQNDGSRVAESRHWFLFDSIQLWFTERYLSLASQF